MKNSFARQIDSGIACPEKKSSQLHPASFGNASLRGNDMLRQAQKISLNEKLRGFLLNHFFARNLYDTF
jgi:hypothetical protein